MLEVLPIQDKAQQEVYCLRCNIKYDPDLMAYAAYEDGELVGVCQFTIKPDGGQIIDLACVTGKDVPHTLFVMGRATLNFIDLCGVHKARFVSDRVDEALIRSIGFKKNDNGIYEIDLTHFFEHPCQHCG